MILPSQPLSWYVDSGAQHLNKMKQGLVDEPHDRAWAWNAVCFLETKRMISLGLLPKDLDDLPAPLPPEVGRCRCGWPSRGRRGRS